MARLLDHAKGGRASGGVEKSVHIFSSGSVGRAPSAVVQDKPSLTGGLKASAQPGAVANGQSPVLCSNCQRSHLRAIPPVKLVHTTAWLDPRVRAELQREATARGLSLSEMVAIACRDWVCYEIHRQQTTLFEEKQRRIVREEIASLRDSLVHFEMKNARASEQTLILTIDLLKRQLKREGIPPEELYKLVDEADSMADTNILNRSPKFTDMLAAWQAAKEARRKEAKVN